MRSNDIRVVHWPYAQAADESVLRRLLAQERLTPYCWANAPGDVYGAHMHPYHKVLYVVRGSIRVALPNLGKQFHLRQGDRLDLPAGIVHEAVVGDQGVVCLEAHR